MRADYHVHTKYSDDSDYPMEEVVQDAIRLGLEEICFTDHVDYGIKRDWDSEEEMVYQEGNPLANVNVPLYAEEIRRLQQLYGDRITLKMGLEFGVQSHTIPQFEQLYARYPFDFIILSVHQIMNQEFWNQDYQKGRSQKEYNEDYYKEMLYLVNHYSDYSVLGHMDLILRYDRQGIYPFEKVRPLVEEILRKVIQEGKGIEVNTSSHRYGLSDSTPSREILQLYYDLGGRIVTIGSDSHIPKHLGAYIDEARKLLKAIGFEAFCTYEKMKPVFHDL